ncbi:MAG: AMP-binding protein, partial [Blastocatellia bacterium]
AQQYGGHSTRFDLELQLWDEGEGIEGTLTYSTDLFDETTIARLLAHFKLVLEAATKQPATCICALPILTEAEHSQLLIEWNDTAARDESGVLAHVLFEAQVERTSDAIAVLLNGQLLSYQCLNSRSNQVARWLRSAGAKPETPVGLYLDVSIEMIVAMLAVLKSGAAYVPLDPTEPQDRCRLTISDASLPLVLTRNWLINRLSGVCAEVLNLDAELPVVLRESEANLEINVASENLAYIIYTSGSTGKPKGVGTQHSGLSNLVIWHQKAWGITPTDRQSQFARLAFDASVWETLPPLISGACVVLLEERFRALRAEVADQLVREQVTLCFLPTPLAEVVLNDQCRRDASLRTLFVGGDKLRNAPDRMLPF